MVKITILVHISISLNLIMQYFYEDKKQETYQTSNSERGKRLYSALLRIEGRLCLCLQRPTKVPPKQSKAY